MIKLKELVDRDIRFKLKEAKSVAQENVGNVFITKYSNGYVTLHVGGRSNSTIQFSKSEASKLHKVLMKMT